jgi:hypothetical protein
MRAFVALLILAMCMPAVAADAPREVHGAADAFAVPGVALAWAVLRGRDAQDAQVVMRIELDTARYADAQVVGIDPFSHATRTLPTQTVAPGVIELRAPRASFADWPRTEVRLRAAGAEAPALVVYYLGVPDTTPEFTDEARLASDLAARLARARANPR